MLWNWQRPNWPDFHYDTPQLAPLPALTRAGLTHLYFISRRRYYQHKNYQKNMSNS
ncbi:MAG: DUF4172 domain-containing protein [Gammaproteobacteria bacterium]|nr:DUF4172 domain-containing protein [Gammaproteobacteria bacterium]